MVELCISPVDFRFAIRTQHNLEQICRILCQKEKVLRRLLLREDRKESVKSLTRSKSSLVKFKKAGQGHEHFEAQLGIDVASLGDPPLNIATRNTRSKRMEISTSTLPPYSD